MSVTATRTISIVYSGDVAGGQEIHAATNSASPGQIQVVTLALGDNTITVPTGGTVPTACTIMKPSGNTTAILIMKIGGETGIRLHNTDPDCISLDQSVASFVLNAAAQVVGVRLVWS